MSVIDTLIGTVQQCSPRSSVNLIEAKIAQVPLRLVSLPVELLTEVLRSLTWRDLLCLRATCKYLSDATKTRSVWAHLVDQHVSSKLRPPLLERPLSMHTAEELERLLLVWTSADIGWERDDGRAARERSILVEPAEYLHLIQGGRWLLVTTDIGQVTYYDLDAEVIEGVQLIPQQIHKPFDLNQIMMDIDIDSSSPTLSFRIALSVFDRSLDWTGNEATMQVWAVTLLLNGLRAVGLSATRLALLHHRFTIVSVMALSLLGPTVAFTAQSNERCLHTFVLKWDQADGDSTNYPWRVMNPSFYKPRIQLLRGNKLFVASRECMRLFDYSVINETTHILPSSLSASSCLWTTSFNTRFTQDISTLNCFFTPNTAQIYMSTSQCIHSITVESEPFSDEPPPIIKVLDSHRACFFPDQTSLGYTRAIVVDCDHVAWLVRYTAPDKFLRKPLSTSTLPPVRRVPVMDEESGRVVFPDFIQSRKMTIIDFAVVFMS
ncbi:hypothetical protein HYPSUDRAFT_39711 [Hypholoma sublateritium FD-334 SS-4]|uniref:F-box domain-containing protein n=1 Tax=Hypholoma sublateritium (strain FD-334 SS-4) TaxID=945553 RepID=A0A0D2MIN2_HYPSF|nr:hypothetical protein HYPSUDRAFT_39711 [Hypholoma sublateritium FD-334 SS-4]